MGHRSRCYNPVNIIQNGGLSPFFQIFNCSLGCTQDRGMIPVLVYNGSNVLVFRILSFYNPRRRPTAILGNTELVITLQRVGEGTERGHWDICLSPNIWAKYLSDKYRVKLGHFVNFLYIYFLAKMSCPKVDYL